VKGGKIRGSHSVKSIGDRLGYAGRKPDHVESKGVREQGQYEKRPFIENVLVKVRHVGFPILQIKETRLIPRDLRERVNQLYLDMGGNL